MSRHVLFSFLGLGSYLPCYYTFEGKKASFSRFTQTAIYELMKKDHKLDVVVFLTKEAKEKNWFDSKDKEGNMQEGLKNAFQRIAPEANLKLIEIRSGQDEMANWELFDAIINEVKEEDTIYFDITHSFRSIPLLTLIVLNYVRLVKKAKIGKLVYGWFESLGTPQDVKKMKEEERLAPIVDMTNMISLLDWTNGVDQFMNTGDASLIQKLTNSQMGFIMSKKENTHEKKGAMTLNKLAKHLEKVGKAMQTCRSLQISDEILHLKQLINEAKQFETSAIKPIIPLIDQFEEKYKSFTHSGISDYFEMARWCYEHGWIQPAYTLLQENVITVICEVCEVSPTDKNKRTDISSAIRILLEGIEEQRWRVNDTEFVKRVLKILEPYRSLLSPMNTITDYRNDLNHAGTNKEQRKPEKFESNFKELLDKFIPFYDAMDELLKEKA